jgi:zinc transporter, ZIP family
VGVLVGKRISSAVSGLSGISRVALTASGYLRDVGQAILLVRLLPAPWCWVPWPVGDSSSQSGCLRRCFPSPLITALTFEMFQDSYEQGGICRAVLGLAVGAVVFTVVSLWLDRMAEGHRKDDHGSEKLDLDAAAQDAAPSPASVSGAAGLALLAAATLDGIPENLVLGVALGEGSGGIALLAAIFAANFPEALVSSASMREQGRSQAFILGTWTICAVLLIFAVVLGAGPLSRTTHETLSLPLAFAAGAVLAALADTLMPTSMAARRLR